MATPPTFNFIYQGIQDEQFAFFAEHYQPTRSQALGFQVNYVTDPAQRIMICEVMADFSTNDGKLFLRCGASCRFIIGEAYWNAKINEEGTFIFLEELVYSHFAAFTIGTLRGILHVRSTMARIAVILPPVNVNQLLRQLEIKPVALATQ